MFFYPDEWLSSLVSLLSSFSMSKGQENPWTSAPLIHSGAVAHVRTTVIVLLEYSGCSALHVLCPKWILQIWSCMQIWSPNGYTRLQFICFTPIWHANCSLPYGLLCCDVGSISIFPRIYLNQRSIYQPSSITSGGTWTCWSNLAKRGIPSGYHYANSDFYKCWQFKPWWWSLIFLSWWEWSYQHNFFLSLDTVLIGLYNVNKKLWPL